MGDSETNKKCAGCSKALNRAKRYYRNGKYFCNKNCFKTSLKKAEKE